MNVIWPEPRRPSELTRVALEDALSILGEETENFTITRYPCLLMTLSSDPIYFGDTLLIRRMDGVPISLARQVFKRHIQSVTNKSVAERLVTQLSWLRQRAQNLGTNETVHPVYFMFPESGFSSLGISGNVHRDVRYVVSDGDESQLQPLGALRIDLAQRVEERITKINLARLNGPDGFEGLPA